MRAMGKQRAGQGLGRQGLGEQGLGRRGLGRRGLSLLMALALCLTALFSLAAPAAAAKDYSTVRVKLSNANDGSINVRFTGDYSVEQNGQSVTGDVVITHGGGGLVVSYKGGGQIYSGKSVRFNRTGSAGTFRMYTTPHGNNQYLGDLLISADGGSFTAVNYIPMDHYLYGVVAHEMNNSWPLEALKAQAVAARGYAADCVGRYDSYDVVDTPKDQVYKGYRSENTNVREAVDGTTGQVLTKDGKIIRAYYGASNGGQTELTENVWTNTTSYCVMKDDPYDLRNTTSPRQTIFVPKSASSGTPMDSKLAAYLKTQVAPKLKSMGYSTYSDQIEIVGVSALAGSQRKYPAPSRNYTHVKATVQVRAMTGSGDGMVVESNRGSKPVKPEFNLVSDSVSGPVYADASGNLYDAASVEYAMEEYEAALAEWQNGETSLTSSGQGFTGSGNTVSVDVEFRIYDLKDKTMSTKLFTNHSLIMYYVEEAEGGWNIVNARYGHGVGMSQRGAQQMAKEGKSYQDILFFYYEGVKLTDLGYAGGGSVPDLTTGGSDSSGETDSGTDALAPISEDVEEILDSILEEEEAVVESASGSASGAALKNTTLYNNASGTDKVVTIKKGASLNLLAQTGDMILVQTKAGTTGFAKQENVQVNSAPALASAEANLTDESGSIIGTVKKGEKLTIVGQSGSQYQVQSAAGQLGYLLASGVQLNITSPKVILPEGKRYGQTTGKIKLYKNKNSKTVLTNIPSGGVVEVVSKTSNGYYNVVYNGQKGAVKTQYVKLLKKGARHPDPKAFIALYTGKNSASVSILSLGAAAGAPTAKYGAILRLDPAVNEGEITGTLKGQTVNMRKEASTGAIILKQLAGGDKVTVIATVGDFYQVRDSSGAIGYIVKDWVDVGGATVGSGTSGGSTGGASSGSGATSRIGTIRSDGVNVRSSASMDATVVGTLQNGAQVDVISSSGSFYKIRSSTGMEGYVSDQYISVQEVETDMLESVDDDEDDEPSGASSAGSDPAPSTVVAQGTITGANVKMRAKASSSAEVLTTIPAGTDVGIIATNNGYYKVYYNGYTGYVLSTYIPSNTLRQSGSAGGSSAGKTTGVVSVGSTLRLRDADGNVIGSLANGATVTILATRGDQYRISAGSQTGYVAKQYIKLAGSGASSSGGSSSGSSSSGSSSSGSQTGTVTANSLRLRTLEGTVLGTLTKGTKVTIQQTLSDRYKVTAGGRIGYVSKQYVKLDGGSASSSDSGSSSSSGGIAAGKKGQANAGVNVRASTSTSAKRLGVVYKNEVVKVLGSDGDWYKIEAKGMTGYVQKKYIDKV